MLILSNRQLTAKKIKFGRHSTQISGANDTGKSSLIKSIYYAFGGDIHNNATWVKAEVTVLVKFEIGGRSLSVFRHGKYHALFETNSSDENEINLIVSESKITGNWSEILAEILQFKLKLVGRNGKSSTPIPAYHFLPFYIDQDEGWTETWSSFDGLGTFSSWKPNLVDYCLGIKPKEHFELNAKKQEIAILRKQPQHELDHILILKNKASTKLSGIPYDINIESFKTEIDDLLELVKSNSLKMDNYRSEMVLLKNEVMRLEAQRDIANTIASELNKDYEYAVSEKEDIISCPTCGNQYENDIANRFDITNDEHWCINIGKDIADEINKVKSDIESTRKKFTLGDEYSRQLQTLLDSKTSNYTLKDLISREAVKEHLNTLSEEANEIIKELNNLDAENLSIEAKIKLLKDNDKTKAIKEDFSRFIKRAYIKLKLSGSDKAAKNYKGLVKETGSDRAREILAYFFTVIHLIWDNQELYRMPIIIDTPKQQDIDDDNYERMLTFIKESLPEDAQFVIGMVEPDMHRFDDVNIQLSDDRSVLNTASFEEVSKEIALYNRAIIEQEPSEIS